MDLIQELHQVLKPFIYSGAVLDAGVSPIMALSPMGAIRIRWRISRRSSGSSGRQVGWQDEGERQSAHGQHFITAPDIDQQADAGPGTMDALEGHLTSGDLPGSQRRTIVPAAAAERLRPSASVRRHP